MQQLQFLNGKRAPVIRMIRGLVVANRLTPDVSPPPVRAPSRSRRLSVAARATSSPSFGEQQPVSANNIAQPAPVPSTSSGVGAAAAPPQQGFVNRVIYGTFLGILGAAFIIVGNWWFASLITFVAYQSSVEYFGFITAKNVAAEMAPPPPWIAAGITAACVSTAITTQITGGRMGLGLALSSFLALILLMFASEKPRLSQFTSTTFGLMYCGFMPSFWIKLRLLNIPALGTDAALQWPVLLGGLGHWTLGLVCTFMAVGCVIFADTGAYFVGKNLGRTPLTRISPKKTVEGALGGWASSIVWAFFCRWLFSWPANPVWAALFGTVVFFSSLFGDLIESVMKRDAGLKDSGNLIPGHGGLLDRFDSYMFTGAVVYALVMCGLPMPYGL